MNKKEDEKGFKMYGNIAHNVYAQNDVQVESPAKLIEMLYEGVLRFNAQAKKAMKDGNVEKKVYWINRSISIITELISILNVEEEGSISKYLFGLYSYEIQLITQAGIDTDSSKLDECSHVFKELLAAWRDTTDVA